MIKPGKSIQWLLESASHLLGPTKINDAHVHENGPAELTRPGHASADQYCKHSKAAILCVRARVCVCLCACVCETRAQTHTHTHTHTHTKNAHMQNDPASDRNKNIQ